MKNRFFETEKVSDSVVVKCQGEWSIYTVSQISKEFKRLQKEFRDIKKVIYDFSLVQSFDSGGMILLIDLEHITQEMSLSVELRGMGEKQSRMIDLIEESYSRDELPKRYENPLEKIGRATIEEFKIFKNFFNFIGETSVAFLRLLIKPTLFRFRETAYHIEQSGFHALFIISLTSLLVGLVVAYQSIVQLAKFGADIFVIDATGIAVTRELGPMITAIVIAGRSASSYAAEIGTMKITEEINAMRTMGFDPFYFLVVPRVVALIISMPLLIFFSDLMGILGGMIATKMQADISFTLFLERLQEVLDAQQYILGMIKGPFFAIIIALTGCFHGFRVTKDTESIGIETTASVVHAIFFVIACDALFSVIYTQLGL